MPFGWKRRALSTVVSALAPVIIPRASGVVIRILNYHRINNPHAIGSLDGEVLSASPELFDEEVRFCKQHFDVLSFGDLRRSLDGSVRLPPRPLIITFDDGYRDNYQHAFPILKSHGVTAMFFVAVGFIGSTQLFWWDAVAHAIKTYKGPAAPLSPGRGGNRVRYAVTQARLASIKSILRRLKALPNQARVDAVAKLSESASASDSEPTNAGGEIMTWSEVREMHAAGMEIGSHSMTHPVLSKVEEADRLRHEMAGSKAALEESLGAEVSVFSYPVGGEAAIGPDVIREVQRAGYQFAVSYLPGVNHPSPQMDRYSMRRLHVDGLDLTQFRARLALPTI